jgi:3-hydroxybutyryl-CoA dehydrogenase
MDIETVGVLGAGVIGIGVAQNLAESGFKVLLIDVQESILAEAKARIRENIRFQRLFNKGRGAGQLPDPFGQISFTTDHRALSRADYVIENVTENWAVKHQVYRLADSICPGPVIFAANTSAIPITKIASVTGRPSKVIGIHFMNPVALKTTVEMIRGHHTDEQTIQASRALLGRMGKQCVIVNDSPGFVSNRVLMLTVNEAIFLLQEGVASAEDIDRIFKDCFGHKMGPLETADLIGLDTVLYSIQVLYESFNDDKYRPCPLLKKMVDAGLHGRKTGRGFYSH